MKKGKTVRRMMSALLAVLLCMSCVCSPMAFAADEKPPETNEPPLVAGSQTEGAESLAPEMEPAQADETEEPGVPPLDEGESGGTATPGQTAESAPEPAMSEASQAFVDAVSALDRNMILSAANAWGLAHRAWEQDQENPALKAALDKAVTASDEATAALYAAEGSAHQFGAGDQGVMAGYVTDETPAFLPLPVVLAHVGVTMM